MKKLLFGLLFVSMSLFYACQKDTLLTAGDPLIDQIISSGQKVSLTVAELPTAITDYLALNYAPAEIEEAYQVPELGYELWLDDGQDVYFDARGGILAGGGRGPRHPVGCLVGKPVDASELPSNVLSYLSANYTDATIEKAVKKRGGAFAVKLSDGTVVLFDPAGEFVRECERRPNGPGRDSTFRDSIRHRSPCMNGDVVDLGNLSQSIVDYVAQNYPNATILRAVTTPMGGTAVRLSNEKVLLFDANGEFLHLCGVRPNGPGNGHGPGHGPGMGNPIDVADLPAVITDFIALNHPGTTIDKAVRMRNGDYAILLDDGTRLLFDKDGNPK